MSNTPKIISNLGEISQNGIPLGSLLEAFPALHSSFLFLLASFQQEACIYVLSAVGLWDSAWQMANLPDRSKCINYHKIRWFWNAMIYLYQCVSDPTCKSLHAVRRFVPQKSPGKIRKTQKDSKDV